MTEPMLPQILEIEIGQNNEVPHASSTGVGVGDLFKIKVLLARPSYCYIVRVADGMDVRQWLISSAPQQLGPGKVWLPAADRSLLLAELLPDDKLCLIISPSLLGADSSSVQRGDEDADDETEDAASTDKTKGSTEGSAPPPRERKEKSDSGRPAPVYLEIPLRGE